MGRGGGGGVNTGCGKKVRMAEGKEEGASLLEHSHGVSQRKKHSCAQDTECAHA